EQQKTMIEIAKTLDDFAKTMPIDEVNLVTSYQEYLHLKKGEGIGLKSVSHDKRQAVKDNEIERYD
ncbi:hypothetical protein ABTE16_20995, partial [Acinetobacter baumannii]